MHPRTAVRKLISQSLADAFPDVRVSAGSVSDLSDADDGLVVEVPTESVTVEGSNKGPLRRSMSVTVTAFSSRPGNGVESLDAAEDLARRAALHLIMTRTGDVIPLSEVSQLDESEETLASVVMTFSVETIHLDDIRAAYRTQRNGA
ncbi:hypothetical protein PARHAE_03254 [Paracoccus haematequi]|uniref:Uncharacterized protein n=1 Tax=Paracoccus haematequi TaxID=2491866 RepID=A0A3S4D127_9RHOB|nr:hypothetical protein [Paracoccus haematequi]VDS10043.1 hypothetical protein PARHAE_03254 [Paracoccus haematequi]